jgi:hypothetical protein
MAMAVFPAPHANETMPESRVDLIASMASACVASSADHRPPSFAQNM